VFSKEELLLIKKCLFKLLMPRYISINGPNEKEIAYAPLNLFECDNEMDDEDVIIAQSAMKKVIEEIQQYGT